MERWRICLQRWNTLCYFYLSGLLPVSLCLTYTISFRALDVYVHKAAFLHPEVLPLTIHAELSLPRTRLRLDGYQHSGFRLVNAISLDLWYLLENVKHITLLITCQPASFVTHQWSLCPYAQESASVQSPFCEKISSASDENGGFILLTVTCNQVPTRSVDVWDHLLG